MTAFVVVFTYLTLGWFGARFALRRMNAEFPDLCMRGEDLMFGVLAGVFWPLFVPTVWIITIGTPTSKNPDATDRQIRRIFGLPERGSKS